MDLGKKVSRTVERRDGKGEKTRPVSGAAAVNNEEMATLRRASLVSVIFTSERCSEFCDFLRINFRLYSTLAGLQVVDVKIRNIASERWACAHLS